MINANRHLSPPYLDTLPPPDLIEQGDIDDPSGTREYYRDANVATIIKSHIDLAAQAVRLYAESHPRPPHITQKQASEMLGVSRPTICRMVKGGYLRLNKCGKIPISEIDRVLAVERAA